MILYNICYKLTASPRHIDTLYVRRDSRIILQYFNMYI